METLIGMRGIRSNRSPDGFTLCSEPAEAELEVGEGLAQWLQENPAHPSQRLEGTRVRYRVRAAEPFVRWVLGLSEARLLGPEALLSALRQRIQQLQDCYAIAT